MQPRPPCSRGAGTAAAVGEQHACVLRPAPAALPRVDVRRPSCSTSAARRGAQGAIATLGGGWGAPARTCTIAMAASSGAAPSQEEAQQRVLQALRSQGVSEAEASALIQVRAASARGVPASAHRSSCEHALHCTAAPPPLRALARWLLLPLMMRTLRRRWRAGAVVQRGRPRRRAAQPSRRSSCTGRPACRTPTAALGRRSGRQPRLRSPAPPPLAPTTTRAAATPRGARSCPRARGPGL